MSAWPQKQEIWFILDRLLVFLDVVCDTVFNQNNAQNIHSAFYSTSETGQLLIGLAKELPATDRNCQRIAKEPELTID